jgi:hypothetical protein
MARARQEGLLTWRNGGIAAGLFAGGVAVGALASRWLKGRGQPEQNVLGVSLDGPLGKRTEEQIRGVDLGEYTAGDTEEVFAVLGADRAMLIDQASRVDGRPGFASRSRDGEWSTQPLALAVEGEDGAEVMGDANDGRTATIALRAGRTVAEATIGVIYGEGFEASPTNVLDVYDTTEALEAGHPGVPILTHPGTAE